MSTLLRRLSARHWDGVEVFRYDGANPVEKHDLVGPHAHAGHFGVRYFHVPAGGHTEHPRPHDHVVIIERGRALVTVGDQVHDLGPGDVVLALGDELRRVEANSDEPVGFFCISAH